MITDFIHLHHSKSTLIWYDLFMIFCFAFTGLIIAVISIYDMYKIVLKNYNQIIANRFTITVAVLCGFGIYLGRFLRLNSWELFTHPLTTFKLIITSILNGNTWYVSIGFGTLIAIIFSVYKNNIIMEE